jgi:ABC-type uncharacterized transport system substrate-binding protein
MLPTLLIHHRYLRLLFYFSMGALMASCAAPPRLQHTSAVKKPAVVERQSSQEPNSPSAFVKDLVVLQSDKSPAFAGVAKEITKQWKGPVETHSLNVNPAAFADIQSKIQLSDKQVIIAIGMPAALMARKLSGKKVIFCQVFNYEDFDLVTPWMKGVSAVPPVKQQFRAWKTLDPSLTRVGVITGKGLDSLLSEAKAAAKENHIQLSHVEAGSDLEMLSAFKKMSQKVQALWLVPDNRVLSRGVLRNLLSFSFKQGKQVLVFSEQLLPLGGIMSVESDYADIAEQVLERVKQTVEGKEMISGTPVLPLTKLDIKINPVVAQRFGLTVPAALKGLAYAP